VDTTQDPPKIAGRVRGVGHKSHGLVSYQGSYIMLDSDNGALISLDFPTSGSVDASKPKGPTTRTLWQAPEAGRFLKGLAIMDDVAYFGVSEWAPRSARDDPKSNCQLAAFDLKEGKLLWRKEVG
jgi:hypothetical protein